MELSSLSDQELLSLRRETEHKIASYNLMQLAKKILLNGGYGAIGNTSFKFFDIRIAESITVGGRLGGIWIGIKVNEYFNKLMGTEDVEYVVYGDTDSIYVTMQDFVHKFFKGKSNDEIADLLDKIVKEQILPYIHDCYEYIADYLNSDNKMSMDREIIASSAIFLKKKNYLATVIDDEGVRLSEPYSKILGLEAVKSILPKKCKDALKHCYKIALEGNEDEIISFVSKFKKDFYKTPAEELAFPRSCNNIESYVMNGGQSYKSGTPIQVKAAIIYNRFISEYGLEKKYPMIYSGEKIKYVIVKQPNIFRDEVVGFSGTAPEEMELDSYIDRKLMFEKTFLKPLHRVIDVNKWDHKKTMTLEGYL